LAAGDASLCVTFGSFSFDRVPVLGAVKVVQPWMLHIDRAFTPA
jgi:hypothetical protein